MSVEGGGCSGFKYTFDVDSQLNEDDRLLLTIFCEGRRWGEGSLSTLKDGAYYCYCAYVLRISRCSGFLWVVPTNAGIILRGLKLYGESRT